MISIVLYGRNDNYGYNLHKRAALSFNCMAELLTDDDDEILFVDYNTPDDFPTFPEAIQDTLTPLARKRLRILRVRPAIHKRFQDRTRLVALEPVSRNVAVRRSNPKNRWILSTNTDMIFVPQRQQRSLSDMVRDLPAGFYHAPRLEIPETLWEGLDRQKPELAIDTIRNWGSALHLNEIVLGAKTILYDGPGDFQLIERSDLFKYHGFDEEMILGWHVDSNIAKRLHLVYGKVGDLGKEVYGYHCDHTRQITPMHSHTRTENDPARFIDNVKDPRLPLQEKTWGCAGDEIEEVRLSADANSSYVSALQSAIGKPLEQPPVIAYATESYGQVDYDPRHILPFLIDIFVTARKDTVVGWMGVRQPTLEMFASVWRGLGFTQPVMITGPLADKGIPGTVAADITAICDRANAFVFDFGSSSRDTVANKFKALSSRERKWITRQFLEVIHAEHTRFNKQAPRRVVCLNAIHMPYEMMARNHLGAGLTPFATRMRHGFALPPVKGKQDWTAALQVGAAATRAGQAIRAKPNETGVVCYGPYRWLFPGHYRLEMGLSGTVARTSTAPIAVLELKWGHCGLDYTLIRPEDVRAGHISMEFSIDGSVDLTAAFETVVRSVAPTDLAITSLVCEPIERSTAPVNNLAIGMDWLSLLQLGPAAKLDRDEKILIGSDPGFAAYGPYWVLPPGRYEARLDASTSAKGETPFLIVELFSDERYRAVSFVNGADAARGSIRIEFEVHEDETPMGELPIELRLRSMGSPGKLSAAIVRRIGDIRQQTPWISFPDLPERWRGEAAQSVSGALKSILGAVRRVLPML